MRKIVWTSTELQHIALEFKAYYAKFPHSGLTTATAREAMRKALPPTRWRRFSSLKQTPMLATVLQAAMTPTDKAAKAHTFNLSSNLYGSQLVLHTIKGISGSARQELHLHDLNGGHNLTIPMPHSRFTPSVLRVLARELEEFLK